MSKSLSHKHYRVRAPKTPKEGNDLYPCRRRHGEREACRTDARCAHYDAMLICGFARKDMRLAHILLLPVVSARRGFAPFARSATEDAGGDGLSLEV